MHLTGKRVPALVAAALAGALSAPGAARQSDQPSVTFTSPDDGSYVSGPTQVRVQVDPPSAVVQSVTISADGRVLCVIERPPYECAWDAGPKVVAHAIRASVLLDNGRRVARTLRTKGIAYTETVDVDVVQVTATVTDGKGRLVGGLGRAAFRVLEDDVPQEISAFMSENSPLEIIVAVDVSGSMREAMPVVKQAVAKFLRALRPSDRVTLMSFNDNVFSLSRPAADLATRLKAVDRLAAWGGTALYDAVVKSIDQLGRQTGRRALVVFTDGEDLNSRVPADAAERRLESSDAMVYPIGQGRAPGMASLKEILERLAHKSGGRAFFEELPELDAVFARIIDELSNQYLLGYVPRHPVRDGRWHSIRIEAPDRGVKIRARQGYRVAAK